MYMCTCLKVGIELKVLNGGGPRGLIGLGDKRDKSLSSLIPATPFGEPRMRFLKAIAKVRIDVAED